MLESPVENFKEQSSKIRVGIAGGDDLVVVSLPTD
jgi:hypothetical protein